MSDPSVRSSARQTTARHRSFLSALREPTRRYIATESGSAALLLFATVVALVWANSPWSETYTDFWHTELAVRLGDSELELDLKHWVNDGLMVFFFFVVGLEVKRELVMGELTDRRRAAVPVAAAIAGLAIPALVYVVFNPSGEAARAWGIVISTDTAFLLGVLALVGPARAPSLRVFLLTLAVADDVGALTIIAVFYTEDLAIGPLALAAAGIGLMLVMRHLQVWRGPGYLVIGIAVWVAMYESGVHPTIAGVVIALFSVAYAPRREEVEDAARLARAFRQSPDAALGRAARLSVERAISPNERLQRLFHPWTSYVVVPIFAIANAGVSLDGDMLRDAMTSRMTLGVIAGLVVGKAIGISLGVAAAARLRLGKLADDLRHSHVAGGAVLSGIGFTISLFIVDLALDDPELQDQARVGVLAASAIAALVGWMVFAIARRTEVEQVDDMLLDRPVDPRYDHIRGPVDAPLTLVEYGDFECPFCGQATGSVAEVRDHFGDRLRYVFRHLPLSDVHVHAELAAQGAEAAGGQGRFWEMHDLLFAHQGELAVEDLIAYAHQLGLDVEQFTDDLRDGTFAERVSADVASAEASGVSGTPTFFVGERRHSGRHDAATLIGALEATAASSDRSGQPS